MKKKKREGERNPDLDLTQGYRNLGIRGFFLACYEEIRRPQADTTL